MGWQAQRTLFRHDVTLDHEEYQPRFMTVCNSNSPAQKFYSVSGHNASGACMTPAAVSSLRTISAAPACQSPK